MACNTLHSTNRELGSPNHQMGDNATADLFNMLLSVIMAFFYGACAFFGYRIWRA